MKTTCVCVCVFEKGYLATLVFTKKERKFRLNQ